MKSFFKIKKRHVLLLEILIALAIIALCILPMLSPHAAILNQQQLFLKKTTLDHAVNLLYVDVLEQLQKNTIPWQTIQTSAQIPVNEEMLKRAGFDKPLPFSGSFRFDVKPHEKSGEPSIKGSKNTGWYVYKLVVTFVFTANDAKKETQAKYIFPYRLTILRHTPNGPAADKPKEQKEDPAAPKQEVPKEEASKEGKK
jgi:hypothetical protein